MQVQLMTARLVTIKAGTANKLVDVRLLFMFSNYCGTNDHSSQCFADIEWPCKNTSQA